MSPLKDQIIAIIAHEANLPVQRITPTSTLKDLQVDSLTVIEVLYEIEQKFGIEFPQHHPDFDTASVQGLISAVERLLPQPEGLEAVAGA